MNRMSSDRSDSVPRVGMVGAGQLARMTHQAAVDLGIHFEVLADSAEDPADPIRPSRSVMPTSVGFRPVGIERATRRNPAAG